MQIIPLDSAGQPAMATGTSRVDEALAGVVATIGDNEFGKAALAQLNRWIPLCWMSIYRLFDDQPPTMYAAGSFGVVDGTHESWRVYRTSLYRQDDTFAAARELGKRSRPTLLHWNANEIPPVHRQQIYSRHGLRERISIVSSEEESSLLAINLYRHETQPALTDAEIDEIGAASTLLMACVQRHLVVSPPSAVMSGLTARERDVCTRMLKGWTHDGIAADLGVSSATVKTYRDRAFDRLGIHHRNELFALMAGRLERAPQQL